MRACPEDVHSHAQAAESASINPIIPREHASKLLWQRCAWEAQAEIEKSKLNLGEPLLEKPRGK